METRRLGSAGPEITRLGFGAWAAGGPWQFGWGTQDDDASISAIRAAVEGGVNWVDTAAVYGLGHSEEVVAEALEPFDVGAEVLVFTKCGRIWYGSDGESIEYDLRPDSIRFECEQSLKRLGVERLDLYQFHWPDRVTGTQVEDSWNLIGELIDDRQGTVSLCGQPRPKDEAAERGAGGSAPHWIHQRCRRALRRPEPSWTAGRE